MGRLCWAFKKTLSPQILNISSLVVFSSPRGLYLLLDSVYSWRWLDCVKLNSPKCTALLNVSYVHFFPNHNDDNTMLLNNKGRSMWEEIAIPCLPTNQ